MSQSVQRSKDWSSWHERLHKKLKKNQNLLPHHATLLLGVSGGQDSMALLKLILDLKRIYKWKINVWHGDHGWHEKSFEFAEELQNWCVQEKINFFCSHAKKEQTATEAKARDWRYQNLQRQADLISTNNSNSPCERVLTGHTGTDRAETFIMNLARGADLSGLSTLKEKRILYKKINLIRPLLIFSRDETMQICKRLKLPVWLDPSNKNLNLTRNKIRHEILPILEEIHNGSGLRIAALAERMSQYKENQKVLADALLSHIQRKTDHCLDRAEIVKLSPSARRTIIATWLLKTGISKLNSLQLEEISHKLSKEQPPGSSDLPGGYRVKWNQDVIELSSNNY